MSRIPKLLSAALLVLLLGATTAWAQVRSIPDAARRGLIRHVQEMTVEINGRPVLLAPGAQIRSSDNLIVLPAAVPAGSLVKFMLDEQGRLSRAWVLTAEEAATPDPRR